MTTWLPNKTTVWLDNNNYWLIRLCLAAGLVKPKDMPDQNVYIIYDLFAGYHVIFNVLHSIVENSITEVSLHYIIIDWGCLCLWQSERNQKYGWRYISWYNEAMYSTAWTFNDVKITLIWSLTSISSLRHLMSAHESIVLELKC